MKRAVPAMLAFLCAAASGLAQNYSADELAHRIE
jgi:hypothetical protein